MGSSQKAFFLQANMYIIYQLILTLFPSLFPKGRALCLVFVHPADIKCSVIEDLFNMLKSEALVALSVLAPLV